MLDHVQTRLVLYLRRHGCIVSACMLVQSCPVNCRAVHRTLIEFPYLHFIESLSMHFIGAFYTGCAVQAVALKYPNRLVSDHEEQQEYNETGRGV